MKLFRIIFALVVFHSSAYPTHLFGMPPGADGVRDGKVTLRIYKVKPEKTQEDIEASLSSKNRRRINHREITAYYYQPTRSRTGTSRVKKSVSKERAYRPAIQTQEHVVYYLTRAKSGLDCDFVIHTGTGNRVISKDPYEAKFGEMAIHAMVMRPKGRNVLRGTPAPGSSYAKVFERLRGDTYCSGTMRKTDIGVQQIIDTCRMMLNAAEITRLARLQMLRMLTAQAAPATPPPAAAAVPAVAPGPAPADDEGSSCDGSGFTVVGSSASASGTEEVTDELELSTASTPTAHDEGDAEVPIEVPAVPRLSPMTSSGPGDEAGRGFPLLSTHAEAPTVSQPPAPLSGAEADAEDVGTQTTHLSASARNDEALPPAMSSLLSLALKHKRVSLQPGRLTLGMVASPPGTVKKNHNRKRKRSSSESEGREDPSKWARQLEPEEESE